MRNFFNVSLTTGILAALVRLLPPSSSSIQNSHAFCFSFAVFFSNLSHMWHSLRTLTKNVLVFSERKKQLAVPQARQVEWRDWSWSTLPRVDPVGTFYAPLDRVYPSSYNRDGARDRTWARFAVIWTKTSEQSREQLHIQKVNHNIKRGHVVTLEDQELLTFSSGSVMTGTGSTSMVSSQRDSVGSVARLSHHHRRRHHHRLGGVHGRRVERWKKLK